MRKALKWIGIGLISVLSIVMVFAVVLVLIGNRKLNKQYDVQPEPLTATQQESQTERGQYLASISCMGCHGDNLAGKNIFSDPGLGSIPASNLTAGAGGIGGTYSDIDLVRAVRHGIDAEGKALAIMPSGAYWHYSDDDLGAIVSYLRSVPAVDNDPGEREIKLAGRMLVGSGVLDILAAEAIDHHGSRPTVADGSLAYGEYLVDTSDCRQCHGADLSGGSTGEPGAPPGPDLASVASWSQDEFIAAFRSGVTPSGGQLDPDFMPWQEYGRMTDNDLTTLYNYLVSRAVAITAKE